MDIHLVNVCVWLYHFASLEIVDILQSTWPVFG